MLVERPREEVIGTVERSSGGTGFELRLDPRIGNTAWPLAGMPRGLRAGSTVVAEPGPDTAHLRYRRTVASEDAGCAAVLVVHRIRPSSTRASAPRPSRSACA